MLPWLLGDTVALPRFQQLVDITLTFLNLYQEVNEFIAILCSGLDIL